MYGYEMTLSNYYLCHHGVRGQKWGIRRFQNKDGSLTAAGKKRADKLATQYEELTGKKPDSNRDTTAVKNKPETTVAKNGSNMTDEELQKAISRMELEISYRSKYSELNPKTVSKGKKIADTLIDSMIDQAITGASKAAGTAVQNALTNLLTKDDNSNKKDNNSNKKRQ